MIRGDALETTNRDGFFFDAATTAGGLARSIAHPAENPREDVRLAVFHVRIAELALRDHANVGWHIRVRRTAPLTIDYLVEVIGICGISWLHANDKPIESFAPAYRCA